LAENAEVSSDTTESTPDSTTALHDSAATASAEQPSAVTAERPAQAGAAAQQPTATPAATPPAVTRSQPTQQATLVLDGIPDQAIVIVDRQPAQGSRLSLSPGTHTIAIQALGYREYLDTVRLSAGQTRTFTPQLERLPTAYGALRVGSLPAGTLFIDDVEVGELPVRDHQIAVGEHRIRIEAPGCDPYNSSITVRTDSTVNLGLIRLTCGGDC
jgi:hypothetical protein